MCHLLGDVVIAVETLFIHLGWLPLLLVLFWLYYKEKYPIGAALLAYFLGAFATLPAWLLQLAWRWVWLGQEWAEMWDMPLWIVPVEEGAKLVAAIGAFSALGCKQCRSFFPLAMAAALGFSVLESSLAVMVWGLDVVPVRLLVSVPGHLVFTALAAVGLAGCRSEKPRWTLLLLWGLLAVVAHTAYNHFLLYHEGANLLEAFAWLLAIGTACGVLVFLRLRRGT
jgi:hypothetical protein